MDSLPACAVAIDGEMGLVIRDNWSLDYYKNSVYGDSLIWFIVCRDGKYYIIAKDEYRKLTTSNAGGYAFIQRNMHEKWFMDSKMNKVIIEAEREGAFPRFKIDAVATHERKKPKVKYDVQIIKVTRGDPVSIRNETLLALRNARICVKWARDMEDSENMFCMKFKTKKSPETHKAIRSGLVSAGVKHYSRVLCRIKK
jgi:hypothetical protein